MKDQIYKLENEKWIKTEIEDIKIYDIFKVFNSDTGEYETNAEKGIVNICVRGCFKDEDGLSTIQSKPSETTIKQ